MTDYLKDHPIEFNLYDSENGQRALYITSNPAEVHSLTLELHNISDQSLTFQTLIFTSNTTPPDAGPNQHHLELIFQPNTLSPQTVLALQKQREQVLAASPDWKLRLGPVREGQPVSLYLGYMGSTQPLTLAPDQRVALVLKGISAAADRGARPTQIQIKPSSLFRTGDASQTRITGSRILNFFIIGRLGSRTLPVRLGFIGPNRILADGRSETNISLQLINVARAGDTLSPDASITFKKDVSWLYLTADFGTQDWTLCKDDEFPQQVQVSAVTKGAKGAYTKGAAQVGRPIPGGLVEEAADPGAAEGKNVVLGWTPAGGDLTLAPADYIQIELLGVRSSAPWGQAKLYLHYAGVPGYWDGRLDAVVEKSPLLFLNGKVGIGTDQPHANLEISLPNTDATTKPLSIGKGNDNYFTVHNNGMIGIGRSIAAPNAKLEIFKKSGETSNILQIIAEGKPNTFYLVMDKDGKVGIGKPPTEQLDVKGKAKISGSLTVDGTTTLNDQVTIAKDKNLIANGKVGIGTPTPATALDVKGDLTVSGMMKGILKPDFDSGWIDDDNFTDHGKEFYHRLGKIPTLITIYFAPDRFVGTIHLVNWNMQPNVSNPTQVWVDKENIILQISKAAPLYTTWNLGNLWIHPTGYWRVLAWQGIFDDRPKWQP